MGELSLVKKGGSGPKIQVLTASSSLTTLTVTGVTITPTRIFVSITDPVPTNGYIDTYVKSDALNYYTVEYGKLRGSASVTISNGTLTIGAASYYWYGNYQIVLIED